MRGQTIGAGPVAEERQIMARLAEVLAREEAMEKQRSRVQWLHEGDWNTIFFQAKVKQCSRTNKIRALRRADGSLCEPQEELEGLAAGFYRSLFTAQEDTAPELVTQYIPRRVSELMNVSLATEFSHKEVRKVVFMMHPNKSPGPDGFTAGFYQRHWELVGHDISTTALSFLNGGQMAAAVNSTILVLSPKVKKPTRSYTFQTYFLVQCSV